MDVKQTLEKLSFIYEYNQNKIDKTINYYLKTLYEYEKQGKEMPEEAVEMFNLLEGNK